MRNEIEIHPRMHGLHAVRLQKPAHICAGTVRAEDGISHGLRVPKLRGAICDRIVRAETEARAQGSLRRTRFCSATTLKLKPANTCDGTACTESENCPPVHRDCTP